MLKPTFSKQRPTRPGYYLAWRKDYNQRPEFIEVRLENGELWYGGHISHFPLAKVEKNVLFSEAINLKGDL